MVRVIPFCSLVAELNRWLGTQKLLGVDCLAQTRQVHIKSPRTHLHTPPNPTCSRWYDHEWLKADYKPDSPTICPLVRGSILLIHSWDLPLQYLWPLDCPFMREGHLYIESIYMLFKSLFNFMFLSVQHCVPGAERRARFWGGVWGE